MNKKIFITIDLEEWFHTNFFNVENILNNYYNGNYPKTDVLDCVKYLIEVFETYEVDVTFFVLGETAEKYPNLIHLLKDNNHEIACHSYYHNKKYNNLESFKKDILFFKENIYPDVKGFRFPNFNFSLDKLEILIDQKFQYDSSIVPCRKIPGWYGNPNYPIKPFEYKLNKKSIKEFPIAVSPRLRLPGGGGWYLRNIGYWWTKNIVKSLLKEVGYANIYVHPWEFSENNPTFNDIPSHVYRRTGEYSRESFEKLISNFDKYKFLKLENIIIEK